MNHITAHEAGTISHLFQMRVARSPQDIAYRQYDAAADRWRDYRWNQIEERVACWRAAFLSEKLDKGDRVAILMANGVDWICFDQAAVSLGLVVVPFYPSDSPDNFNYFLNDTDARMLLCETARQWQEIAEISSDMTFLKRVVIANLNCGETTSDQRICGLDDWLPAEGSAEATMPAPDDLATIVYTSGTTGRPKGVMLTHRNILSAAEAVLGRVPGKDGDAFISYLPLAHIFERSVGYYVPIMSGATVGYARSIETLADDLAVIQPTVFLGVPRVFERAYIAIGQTANRNSLARSLLDLTLSIGWHRFEAAQGRAAKPVLWDRIAWRILSRLVCRKVHARLGGRIRVAVTGGAPMSPSVWRFFVSLGVPLIEGYGLAEAAGAVCACSLEDNVACSVGRPLTGVEVKTGQDGELLVKGASVMAGYWKQPESAGHAFDDASWLHTGDIAEIVDGHVFIKGRLKEILITSTGENISPSDLEAALIMDPLIAQVMVVGDRRPFLGALIIVQRDAWRDFAERHGISHDEKARLDSPQAKQAVLTHLAGLLEKFPRHAQIGAVHLSFDEWTVEDGLMTATLKVRRDVVAERFCSEIEELYVGHEQPDTATA